MKIPRIPIPESLAARIGAGVGVVALLAVGIYAFRGDGPDPVDRVEFQPDEARSVVEEGQATDEIIAEFRSLEPYETMTPAELADALARAEAVGRLIGDGFTVPNAVGRPLPDEMFTSYLLIGADASGRRADVLVYLIEPADGSQPLLVSIPRDLYLVSPCTDELGRINANLNGCGDEVNGPTLVALAVENFTGIAVDHFASVDFAGFERVVDSFGGIELCFDNPTRDSKSKLDVPAGCHIADGAEVLAYARSRRTEELIDGAWIRQPVNDFTRQDHQQEVIWQLIGIVDSFASFDDFVFAAGSFQGSLALDDSWSFIDAIQTAFDHSDLSTEDVTKLDLEFDDYVTPTGAAVLVPTMTFTEILETAYPPAAQ